MMIRVIYVQFSIADKTVNFVMPMINSCFTFEGESFSENSLGIIGTQTQSRISVPLSPRSVHLDDYI